MTTALAVFITFVVSASAQNAATSNLQTCMSGKYPALCDHTALSIEQAKEVHLSENRENLQLCLTGRYPALCDHTRLTPNQAASVREAERVENFKVCSSGRYPALCNHSLLTSEQAKAVSSAEANSSQPASTVTVPPRTQPGGCVSGLSIESVDGDGKIIKLDDGSMWEVDDVDTVDTALWLATEDVVLCDGKMINTDDNESADVTKIRADFSGSTESRGVTPGYTIEASANDETFVINREVFKAKTYCFNFDKGDRVKFIEGSPHGACASAKLLNLRNGKMCEVWCGD
jgi:hypothetical protein